VCVCVCVCLESYIYSYYSMFRFSCFVFTDVRTYLCHHFDQNMSLMSFGH